MTLEEGADLLRVLARALHAQFDRFQTAQQHPCGIRIGDAAHRVAQRAHRIQPFLRAGNAARDKVRMAANVFGQRIDDDVRPVLQRSLPQRPEKRVVDRDRAIPVEQRIADLLHEFDIDQCVGRVARALEIDHRDLAAAFVRLVLGLADHRFQFFLRSSGGEIEIGHAELGQYLGDEPLASRVERPGMDDHVSGRAMRHQHYADCGHPARKAERVLRPVPDREAVLEDFLVGTVEARIDKAFRAALADAGDAFEMPLARRRVFEREGAGQKDRRLQGAFREARVEAVPHHQRRGFELPPGDLGHLGLGLAAGGRLVGGIDCVGHGPAPSYAHAPRKAGASCLASEAPVPNLRRNASPPRAGC